MNRDMTPRGESKVSVRCLFQCLLNDFLSTGKQSIRQEIYQEKSVFAAEQNHPGRLWVCFIFFLIYDFKLLVAVTIFSGRKWSLAM